MATQLIPSVGARRLSFDFAAGDCLYKNHRGHRVLTDVEGRGSIRIFLPDHESLVNVEIDGSLVPFGMGEFRFERFVTVSSSEEGAFRSSVLVGAAGPFGSELLRSCECSGWLTGGSAVLDGVLTTVGGMEYPAPFFFSCDPLAGASGVFGPPYVASLLASASCRDLVGLAELGFVVQNQSKVNEVVPAVGDPFSVVYQLNRSSFTVEVPPGTVGIRLVRVGDGFHGRQRARVFCNGKFVGWWYEPVQNRVARRQETSFSFELPVGCSGPVELVLDPPAGAPLWSFSSLEIWGLSLGQLERDGKK